MQLSFCRQHKSNTHKMVKSLRPVSKQNINYQKQHTVYRVLIVKVKTSASVVDELCYTNNSRKFTWRSGRVQRDWHNGIKSNLGGKMYTNCLQSRFFQNKQRMFSIRGFEPLSGFTKSRRQHRYLHHRSHQQGTDNASNRNKIKFKEICVDSCNILISK